MKSWSELNFPVEFCVWYCSFCEHCFTDIQMKLAAFFACILLLAGCAPTAPHADSPTVALPGPRPDGSVLLPNQWSLRPAGKQVELGDFPVNVAVHPGGAYAAVLHCGFGAHEVVVVDLGTAKVVSRTRLHEAFYGVEFSGDGKKLFCSGAGDEVVHCYEFLEGTLGADNPIHLRDAGLNGVPAGLAVERGGGRLWTADLWGNRVTRVDLRTDAKPVEILFGANSMEKAEAAAKPAPDFDTLAATKRADAALMHPRSTDTFPYACRLDEKRQRLYVSLWAQAAVAVVDTASGRVLDRWPTQEHPCEMALSRSGKRLFVANSARNTVTVFDADAGRAVETISAGLYPQSLPGSTPNSVALSPDEHTLFIANADNNTVAVFDVSKPGKSRSLGFIPVGWYPTSVRVTPDGSRLLVANGKGAASKANPKGQFTGGLLTGGLSIIELPSGKREFDRRMAEYTAAAYRTSPLRPDSKPVSSGEAGNPVPRVPGLPSPIKYCLYIIKENRTYDQVLGDMPEGNGDAKLCLFPERVTPNHHRLAREFVLLDNFYVDAEVSADGHEWSMGAYATDFVEKTWPLDYRKGSSKKFPYPSEGVFPVAYPAGGYIWDRARAAGVSYRSYGEFVQNGANVDAPSTTRVPALRGHFDERFHGFDLSYPDARRADRFIGELARFEREGEMPRLQILRLPNDHTCGASRGMRTPTAYLGDNDLALGRVVEAVSRSKFWSQTAIFVVEDDAQNGPDHVDAHRSIAFVISPYTRRHAVDSTMYSSASVLRTMELILGLSPMSQFDAAAMPMHRAFQPTPDPAPYQAMPTRVDVDERNGPLAWGGQFKMDFSKEDAADDLLLNEVVWRSVRGVASPMPAPVRAAFVFARAADRDDD